MLKLYTGLQTWWADLKGRARRSTARPQSSTR